MAGAHEDAVTRLWSLTAADAAEALRARGTAHRLRCAIQLCALRTTGRLVVDYRRVPPEAVNHLAHQLGLDPVLTLPDPIRPATETAQLQRIRRHLGWHAFDPGAEQRPRARLQERAFEDMLPGLLLAWAEDLLRAARIVLPAPSTLERLVASVAANAAQDLFERIAAGLPDSLRDAIEGLVEVPEGGHRSPLAYLKQPPPAARATAVAARLARLDLVEGLLGTGVELVAVTPHLLQHLAQLGRRYDAQALKRFATPKRHALVAAFLVDARKALLDQAVAMHDQYMTGLDRRSRLAFEVKYRAVDPATGTDTILSSSVTAPLRAEALPHSIVAPVSRVMLVSARILSANIVVVPRVAELATCQKTLAPSASLTRSTDEALAVISVRAIWKMKTVFGSPSPSRVTSPVIPSDDVDLQIPGVRISPPRSPLTMVAGVSPAAWLYAVVRSL
jgi:hypothetical protein